MREKEPELFTQIKKINEIKRQEEKREWSRKERLLESSNELFQATEQLLDRSNQGFISMVFQSEDQGICVAIKKTDQAIDFYITVQNSQNPMFDSVEFLIHPLASEKIATKDYYDLERRERVLNKECDFVDLQNLRGVLNLVKENSQSAST